MRRFWNSTSADRVLWAELARAFLSALAFTAYNWAAPELLRGFVARLSTGGEGCVPVMTALIASTFLSWAVLNDCFSRSFSFGLLVRARCARALTARLARENRAESLIAFLAHEIPKIQKGAESVPLLLLTSATVAISCVLLVRFLGRAGLWGVAALASFGIVAHGLALRLARASAAFAEAGRRRTRLTEFLVSCVETIWVRGWKRALGETMAEARRAEAGKLRGVFLLVLATNVLFSAAPLAAAGAALLPSFFSSGRLDPGAVFPALMVLAILRSAFAALPRVVAALVQGADCAARLRRIMAQTPPGPAVVPFPVDGLPDLNGKTVVVVGAPGSGKSSCLKQLAEKIGRGRRLAYLEQTPWVFSGTVAENVQVLERPDADKLKRVLELVELDRDLKILRRDESMMVEPRGRNLSGGQRQRLALARALYLDPDIFVLDQPLGALDPAVRGRVRDKLRRALAGKTVIVAAAGRDEAPAADVVVEVGGPGVIRSFQ